MGAIERKRLPRSDCREAGGGEAAAYRRAYLAGRYAAEVYNEQARRDLQIEAEDPCPEFWPDWKKHDGRGETDPEADTLEALERMANILALQYESDTAMTTTSNTAIDDLI